MALIVGYYLFITSYAGAIAEKYPFGGEFNLLIMPFALGFIACYLFSGFSMKRVSLVALVPIISLIPKMTEGGDPAKPGLEYFVYLIIIVSFCVGAFSEIGVGYLYRSIKHGRGCGTGSRT